MPERTSVAEVVIAAAWNVQGDPANGLLTEAVARRFLVALPHSPNTTARSDALTAFWLGPRSWLLVAAQQASPLQGFSEHRDALNAVGGALFDVSMGRIGYRIAGPHAPLVLASGCPLDFHPRAFAVGGCAQSVFGRVNALFHKADDAPTFVVLVARSHGREVARALRESIAHVGDVR